MAEYINPTNTDPLPLDVDVDVDADAMMSGSGYFFAHLEKGHCGGSLMSDASYAPDAVLVAY